MTWCCWHIRLAPKRRKGVLEALGRVELPTNGLGNRCSIHLSYRASLREAESGPSRGSGFRLRAPASAHARNTPQFRKPLLYPSELQGRFAKGCLRKLSLSKAA